MKKVRLLLLSFICMGSFSLFGQNLIPNGDFTDWPDGQTFPSHFASGSSHTDWISRVEGRDGSGYAARLRQPSGNNSLHRRIRANKISLQAGRYHFSAWLKGVGTIRWIKVNKTEAISGDDADPGVNIIGVTDISTDSWKEISLFFEIEEANDYYISVDFFKTTNDSRPFLLDDLFLEEVLPGVSGTIVFPDTYSGLKPGRQLISFGMSGKGSVNEIGLVNAAASGLASDTVIAVSNLVGGEVEVSSSTSYRAIATIPEGNNWTNAKVYIKLSSDQATTPAEEAFVFKNMKAEAFIVPKPIAVYLKNLPVPRIGTDTDAAIIQSLKEDGFFVVEEDCSTYPATSPDLEKQLTEFHLRLPDYLPTLLPAGETVEYETVMYVPEGYRVARNVWVWNIVDYGASRALDYVLDTYNKEIVNKYKIPKVASAADMKDRNGMPLSYDLHMDIIYPSGSPAEKVPLLLNFSSNTPRFYPFNPLGEETGRRTIFPLGFLTSGYAFINLDHCFNPLARKEHYSHFNRYSLDNYNGVAYYTAALRYIHSIKDSYNLNGRIGTMGISKASYGSMIAGNINNDQMPENSTSYGSPNPQQPYQGYPSTATVCYTAVGAGTTRLPNFVSETTVPTITSMGKLDKFASHWDAYPGVINALSRVNNIHLDFWMEEMGHTYPGTGIDNTTGMERYVLFKTFFDRFLKPEVHTKPEVYYFLPREETKDVQADGTFRTLLPDDILPPDMMGLSPFDSITVRFLSPMNLSTIADYIQVSELKSGTKIGGKWVASMKNTCFKFIPDQTLPVGTYKVEALAGAQDAEGNTLQATSGRTFQVSGNSSTGRNKPQSFSIFPNPVQDKLYFTSDALVLETSIYTISGAIALREESPKGYINTSGLSAGVYILNVRTAEGLDKHRIIKE